MWKNRYQGGALELTVNVALLALAGAVATRAPLYVNAPAKRTVQVEQSVNVAALVPAPSAVVNPPAEPTFYKRNAPAVEISPNIAVNFQTAQPSGEYLDPIVWKRTTQPDLATNVAALIPPPSTLIPVPVDPTLTPRVAQAPDVLPNLAVNLQETPPVTRAPLYVTGLSKSWTQVDQGTNIAARILAAVYVPPVPVDPTFYRRWAAFDPIANSAIYAPAETVFISSTDSTYTITRAWTQVDPPQNLAALAIAPQVLIRPFVEQTFTRRPTPVEAFPNLAALIQPPSVVIPAPIEPWIGKRLAPQVDIAPNRAIYAPAEAPIMRQVLNEPASWKVKYQFDQVPNLAALVPVVTPTGLHQVNMGVSFGVGLSRMGTGK